jgi:hypothetical protein
MAWYENTPEENLEELLEDDPEYVEEKREELSELEEAIQEYKELESDRADELQEQKYKLESEIKRRVEDKEIQEIRENLSERQADRLEKMRENGEVGQFDTWLELAKGGITQDEFFEPMNDYDGMIESGYGYFRTKDWLMGLYDRGVPYDKAIEILDEGMEEGKYTYEIYSKLKSMINNKYKV